MAEPLVEFGPHKLTLDEELLQVLIAGSKSRLEELLMSREGHGSGAGGRHPALQTNAQQVAISVHVASPTPPPLLPGTSSSRCLLGVTSNGNTALHLVASRGHAGLAALVCERAPSLAATRSRCLDTPLHCATKAGHRKVAACLLSRMVHGAGAGAEGETALRARNCTGATALHEAVRHGRAEVVDLFMAEAPELAAVTADDGVSPLYLAALAGSARMVRALVRPAPDGTPSPASFAGPKGRTALHAAAANSKEIAQEILSWEPEGASLLSRVDSSGRTALHFAIRNEQDDVIELFLKTEASIARIPDNDGLFPLHYASIAGSTKIIGQLIDKFPNCYELVDDGGRNILHCAVASDQFSVVRYICQDDRFGMLFNAMDCYGNTPLHFAVIYEHPRILSLLLQTMSVDMGIANKDGQTAGDLAYRQCPAGSRYFLNPNAIALNCLISAGARFTPDGFESDSGEEDSNAEEEDHQVEGYMKGTGTIASVLIATVAFAAFMAVPGGFVADDHANPGTAVLARRFAFRAFVVSDAMAFLCSIVATCFLIYACAREIPLGHCRWYSWIASGLVPLGAQFMIATFAFGFHLVLGAANRGLVIFVYVVSSTSVLFCFPGIWVPWHLGLGKAIWRRAGWRGLLDIHQRPSSLRQLFCCLIHSFLFTNIRRPLVAVLILATFLVAIALDVALPNY